MILSQKELQLSSNLNLELRLKYYRSLSLKTENDVIIDLPQDPVRVSTDSRVLNSGNWGYNFLNLNFLKESYYDKGFIPDRKIMYIVIDTMAFPSHSALVPYTIDKKYLFDFTIDKDGIDGHGHGHHCSGIILGHSQNDLGVAHIRGYKTIDKLMSQKGLSSDGLGSSDALRESILKSMDICRSEFPDYTPVFSLSWASTSKSSKIANAIDQVVREGAFVVSAAGNAGVRRVDYPAALRTSLAVGSIDRSGIKSSFSQYGPEIFASAPGRDIWSCYKVDGQYVSWSGTSMATPHFAGMVGHVLKFNPQIESQEDLILHIEDKFKDTGKEGRDEFYGLGYPMSDTLLKEIQIDKPNEDDPVKEEPNPEKPKTRERRTLSLSMQGSWEFTWSRSKEVSDLSVEDNFNKDKVKDSNVIIVTDLEIKTRSFLYFNDIYDWVDRTLSSIFDKMNLKVNHDFDNYDVVFWVGKYISHLLKKEYDIKGNVKSIKARDTSGRVIEIKI